MTALSEFQFEILPQAEAMDGFVFGIGAKVSVNNEGFDPGEQSWLTQDSQNSRRGVKAFGRDVRSNRTWTWASHVNETDVDTALETLEQISTAWSPSDLLLGPGATTAIRYRINDRYRRVFGRPRRFSGPPGNRILGGYVDLTHDFELVDGYTYDDEATEALIPFASDPEPSGFEFPLTLPTVTMPSAETQQSVYVGGSQRVYPVIRLSGPWTNPSVQTDDWTLSLTGTIAAGQWVEIDTRPWALTILNQSGANRSDMLARRTWLEDLWLPPKTQVQVRLGGVVGGGGASARLRWRNAYTSL